MHHKTNPDNQTQFRPQPILNGKPVTFDELLQQLRAGNDPASYEGRWEPVTEAEEELGQAQATGKFSQVREAFAPNNRKVRS